MLSAAAAASAGGAPSSEESSSGRKPRIAKHTFVACEASTPRTTAIVAVLTTQAAPNEQGALLGGLGSIQELCGALGNPSYARLFAYFISAAAPVKLPGAHFVFASALMIACFAVSRRTFRAHEGEIVLPKFD